MREILFRGKRVDNGEWFCSGSLIQAFDNGVKEIYIPKYGEKVDAIHDIYTDHIASITCENDARFYKVGPETVGQYTGLTDKNGKQIFEGDIVKNDWCFICGNSVVKFGQYKTLDMEKGFYQQGHLGFYLEHLDEFNKKTTRKDMMYFSDRCEIIGNIHDNPELLKGGVDNG